jgi:hypothetical protein
MQSKLNGLQPILVILEALPSGHSSKQRKTTEMQQQQQQY